MNRFVAAWLALALIVGVSNAEDQPKGFLGVQLKIEEGKIVVLEPLKDGPADKAGIKSGDVILKINDFKVKEDAENDDLQETVKEVGKYKVGEKIKVVVSRDGKEKTIEATLGKREDILKDKE
jgi:S1-C subfamily serine protease